VNRVHYSNVSAGRRPIRQGSREQDGMLMGVDNVRTPLMQTHELTYRQASLRETTAGATEESIGRDQDRSYTEISLNGL